MYELAEADRPGAADPVLDLALASLRPSRGKILHTRDHKSELPLENATEIHWTIPVTYPLD